MATCEVRGGVEGLELGAEATCHIVEGRPQHYTSNSPIGI